MIRFGQRNDYFRLISAAAALSSAAGPPRIAIIQFHQPGQNIIGIPLAHGGTDSSKKKPCGFIADIQKIAQLTR